MSNIDDMSIEDINELSNDELISLMNERRKIKKFAKHDTDAQTLRDQVLIHGVQMIEKLQGALYENGDELSQQQAVAYDRLWPIIEDMIRQTSDLKKIEAENAGEVLKLVSSGKITLKDATVMMSLLHSKVEIDELPNLLARMESMKSE